MQYEVELFRKVAEQLGWTDKMLKWTCMPWEQM
jgi:hypothetical protein